MWFDSWSDLVRIVLVGGAGYLGLIVVLRSSGKRTLSQLNAFDFVVTVALGSILATALLSADVSWSEGATAFALLALLQFAVAWGSSRWTWLRGLVTSTPALLFSDGTFCQEELRRCRVSESDVRQAIRGTGAGDLSDIKSVILESNGKFSVIPASKYGDGSALEDVER